MEKVSDKFSAPMLSPYGNFKVQHETKLHLRSQNEAVNDNFILKTIFQITETGIQTYVR